MTPKAGREEFLARTFQTLAPSFDAVLLWGFVGGGTIIEASSSPPYPYNPYLLPCPPSFASFLLILRRMPWRSKMVENTLNGSFLRPGRVMFGVLTARRLRGFQRVSSGRFENKTSSRVDFVRRWIWPAAKRYIRTRDPGPVVRFSDDEIRLSAAKPTARALFIK